MKNIILFTGALMLVSFVCAQTITRAEYFINDSDPGFGLANPIAPGTTGSNVEIGINLSDTDLQNLPFGWHNVYFRTCDSNGKWSHTHKFPFEKIAWQEDNLVVGAEYFFDEDPGVGLATYVAFNTPVTNGQVTINIPALQVPAGSHKLYLRTKDINDKWSQTQQIQSNFTVLSFVAGSLISNNQTICYNTVPGPVSFSVLAESVNGPITYEWYRRSGIQTASGTTAGWTAIAGSNNITFTPSTPLTGNTTYACWISDGTNSQWALGQMQITVLPQLNYGVLANGNQTLLAPANPSPISFSNNATGSGSFSFQWYYYDGLTNSTPANCSTSGWNIIPNATSSTFDPPAGLNSSRTYACFVIPTGTPDCGEGCWAAGVRRITVNTVGIIELANSGISIYPNPVKDFLVLETNLSKVNSISIYDYQGRLVKEQNVTSEIERIDIRHFTSGVYVVKIIGNDLYCVKVVKE